MSNPTIEYWSDRNALVLKNSVVVRPFNLMTGSWNTLRIGVIIGVTTGSNANVTGTPHLSIGICSGSQNVFGDPVCGHFLGYRTNAATWTYSSASGAAGTNIHYFHNTANFIRRSSGSADLLSTNIIPGNNYLMANTISGSLWKGRIPWYIDFARSSGAISCSLWYANLNGGVLVGMIDYPAFFRELQSTVPTFTATEATFTQTAPVGVRVDESLSGSFNAVNLAWDREDPNPDVLIYAIAIAILN